MRFAATVLAAPAWQGSVAVISPHLDDAVLSLGASMRAAVRGGARVVVVSVLSGDPASRTPAGADNRAMGFATAGAAAAARGAEDARACRALGVRPVRLGFADDANEPPVDEQQIFAALRDELARHDAVLIPGFPLAHRDHVSVSRIALGAVGPERAVGLYVEQPYATWNLAARRTGRPRRSRATSLATLELDLAAPARWRRSATRPDDWIAKLRAVGEYRSQLRVLRRAPRLRIGLYEAMSGGERVLWCRLNGRDARMAPASATSDEVVDPS